MFLAILTVMYRGFITGSPIDCQRASPVESLDIEFCLRTLPH